MQNEQDRTDERHPDDRPHAGSIAATEPARRRLFALAGLSVLALASIIGGYIVLRALPANGCAHERTDEDPPAAAGENGSSRLPPLFVGWGQPDLAIVVSGQMHGYMGPCGCSEPQHGGLVRRQAFMEELRAKSWDVVGVDLGEMAPSTGIHRQRELKLRYTMKALDLMGYRAVGLGKNEMQMPLTDMLAQWSLENASPRPIASTLGKTAQRGEKYFDMNVRPYEVFQGDPKNPASPRIGVLSLTGPALEDALAKNDPAMKDEFRNNRQVVLPQVFDAFVKEKVDLAMLLYHEYPKDPAKAALNDVDRERRKMAELCARAWEAERKKNAAIPPLRLLMVLTEEPEPPGMMSRITGTPTQILEIGHKGKYVGVVGLFRKDGELTMKYELVRMEPSFEPPPTQQTKVRAVLEEYARHVKAEDLLKAYIRSPHPLQVDPAILPKGGTRFIGSEACSSCHAREYDIWSKTGHAHAFKALVDAARPSQRQFDPECIVCHTVGFRNPEGYNDLPRAVQQELLAKNAPAATFDAYLAKHNAKLTDVGCETCHGPGLVHANNPNDPALYSLINPFRPSAKEQQAAAAMKSGANPAAQQAAAQTAKNLFNRRMERLDGFCAKCHDEENDVHWTRVPFLQKWVSGGPKYSGPVHNSPTNVGNTWLPPRVPAGQADAGKK